MIKYYKYAGGAHGYYENVAYNIDKRANLTNRYYKGLGTSTPVEGKEYFSNLQRHLVPFHPITTEESSQIDMVFRKSRVAERKDWINNYHSGDYVDYGRFIDK